MDIDSYFQRIAYSGSREPIFETLRALQLAHLYTVPFENLDIVYFKRRIVLDEKKLFEKIVCQRRGGFCYELNGLFSQLLQRLGFRVDQLAANVANEDGRFGIDYDHMTLLVHLEESRLVDVGFGDSFREPLRFHSRDEQFQFNRKYLISEADGIYLLEEEKDDTGFHPQYRFTLAPHELLDYVGACEYHQTSPESSFTQRRVCSRATPEGRITLSDMKFVTSVGEVKEERELKSEEELASLLTEQFGISSSSSRINL